MFARITSTRMARPNRDQHYLGELQRYMAQHRVLPPYSTLGQVLGFKGKSGAFKMVGRLVESGHLVRAPSGRLAPGEHFWNVPERA
jgi:hypothetical protein